MSDLPWIAASSSVKSPCHVGAAGADLAAGLREQGIIVRHFGKPARIQDHLRITVGRPDQNQELVQALEGLV